MQLYGLYGLNRVILIIQIKNFNNFILRISYKQLL
jgi:hypothetical protein